jgi:hypothetical protein
MIAAEAAAGAPWWGVPLIAGLFTILGVGAAQVVAWTMDKRKARREDERRWLQDRRQVYAAFLNAATKVHMALGRSRHEGQQQESSVDLLNDINFCRQEVWLIATREVGDAADEVFGHLVKARKAFEADRTSEEWRTLARAFQEKRRRFISTSRTELGVSE